MRDVMPDIVWNSKGQCDHRGLNFCGHCKPPIVVGQSPNQAYRFAVHERTLLYSPLGDSREQSVQCPFHRRRGDGAATYNLNGVCTAHQHLLEVKERSRRD
jgi:hypothetical protein